MLQANTCLLPETGSSLLVLALVAIVIAIVGISAFRRGHQGLLMAVGLIAVAGSVLLISPTATKAEAQDCSSANSELSPTTSPSQNQSTASPTTTVASGSQTTTTTTTTPANTTTTTAAIVAPQTGLRLMLDTADPLVTIRFCDNAPNDTTTVCNANPDNTLNAATSNGQLEIVSIATPGALFNVSIHADPTAAYSFQRFGPGAGITCQQRANGPMNGSSAGIAFGNPAIDSTAATSPYVDFWFTRCSLDNGVTQADFYARLR